jgi:hypothetical protein
MMMNVYFDSYKKQKATEEKIKDDIKDEIRDVIELEDKDASRIRSPAEMKKAVEEQFENQTPQISLAER